MVQSVCFGPSNWRSPFDNFGPALYDALRPGQEPTPGEAEGLMNLFARNDDLGVA